MATKLKPFPHQEQGIEWIADWKNCLIGDDMGLGKTMQLIFALLLLVKRGFNPFPVLIICPASLKRNWKTEFFKWIDEQSELLEDQHKETKYLHFLKSLGSRVFITNYESQRRFFTTSVEKQGLDINIQWNETTLDFFNTIVYDEAHNLINPDAIKTKIANEINRKIIDKMLEGNGFLYGLTGTPVLNSFVDIANLLNVFGHLKHFVKEPSFAVKDKQGNVIPYNKITNQSLKRKIYEKKQTAMFQSFVVKYGNSGIERLNQLGKELTEKKIYFRRDKAILGLPPHHRQMVLVEMSTEYRNEYNDCLKSLGCYLKEYKQKTNEEIRKSLRAEIVVKAGALRRITGMAKLQSVKDYITEMNTKGEKIVVFGIHKEPLTELSDYFNALRITGSETEKEKDENVTAFQTDKSQLNIICSVKSAGVGLTLTAAAYSIHLEMWYNPALNSQTEARIDRIGKTRETYSKYFMCKDTIDERTYMKNEERRDVLNAMIQKEDELEWEFLEGLFNEGFFNN